MKTINFTYTKADGTKSNRTLMVINTPSDKYFGVDLTELIQDGTPIEEYVQEYEELKKKFLKEVETLNIRYDIKHNYRMFFEKQMTNISQV